MLTKFIIEVILLFIYIMILTSPIWLTVLIIILILKSDNKKKYKPINKTKEEIWKERTNKNTEKIFSDKIKNEREYKTTYKTRTIKQNGTTITENNINYKDSIYYKETGIEYNEMITDKGRAGEYGTSVRLERITGYKKFLINTYIKKDNDKTTEIDIIMLHEKGIFVIENKNFKGYIYGDEIHEQWCQITYKGRYSKKFYFYNPIKQNAAHIIWLKKILEGKKIYSIIAFNDEAIIKKAENSNPELIITNSKNIITIIENTIKDKENIYTCEEIDKMYNSLKPYSGNNVSKSEKENHIKEVEEIKDNL